MKSGFERCQVQRPRGRLGRKPELRPLSRPAEPVPVPLSWRPAVWLVRRDEADWGRSRRSRPKVVVRRWTAVRQASARALVRAAAVVGPASREARAARQRRAPPEGQASRAAPQPPAAADASLAALQRPAVEALRWDRRNCRGLWRLLRRHGLYAGRPATRRQNRRPRCALLVSNLIHRSQALRSSTSHILNAVGVPKVYYGLIIARQPGP